VLNQLPDSATMWQHHSQICFATFIFEKSLITQLPLMLDKKISAYLESLEFLKFLSVCVAKLKNNEILPCKI
jgi:hypothetical protein